MTYRAGFMVGSVAVAGAFLLQTGPGFGQAANELPEITVTQEGAQDGSGAYTRPTSQAATKTDTPSLEVPFSVQSVTPQLIQERLPVDLARALETVPGVSIGYGGGFTASGRARVRGFSNISNFKDGFRIGTVTGELDVANISAIEVLKGPASALYGRFEPGGIINFVTKNPVAAPLFETLATGGSQGFARTTLDTGGALNAEQTVTSRFNAAFERSDGFRDFTGYDKYFLAPTIGIQLSESTKLTLKGEFLHYDGAFDRGLPNHPISFSVPISRNFGEPWMRSEKDQWLGSAELVHNINEDWKLRVGAQAAKTHANISYHNYGFPPVLGNTIERTFIKGTDTINDRTVQTELYGHLTAGPLQHKLLFGTEYNYDEWAYALRRGPSTPISITSPVYSPMPPDGAFLPSNIGSYKYNAVGFYAQDEMAWGPFRLLGGGRFDRVRGQLTDIVTGPTPPETTDLWTFAPRLGLTYLITPELSVYGSWARSTRLELDQGLLESRELPKPTRGEQYEAGIKGNFLGGRLQPTVSVFDISKKNAIVPDPINFNFVTQTGELKVRGVEVEVATQPTLAWKILASFTYQDAYISEDTNPALVGNQFQGVPKYQASLWTSYNFGTETQGLTVGGGLFYASNRPTTNANTLFVPSFTRLDLFAAYKFNKATQLQVNLNNVTDEQYYLIGGFGMITPQPPFQAFVTLKHKFL